MTATSRTIHARAITSTPRPRRVASVTATRPFGAVSLFLAATAILGATSLLFLWQTGQATTTAFNIQALSQQLTDDQNQGAILQSQAYGEKSSVQIMPVAIRTYGMSLHNGDAQRTIDVPVQATIQTAGAGPAPGSGSSSTTSASVRLSTTSAVTMSWWQGLWNLLGGH